MNRFRSDGAGLDKTDKAIVAALVRDARTRMADLARQVGLSAPSVTERVRRLEDAGVITGYAAQINPAAIGLPFSAYIRIRPLPGQLRKLTEILQALDGIVACERITGEDCFIAKAHVRSVAALEDLIDVVAPYGMTNTSLIQSSPVLPRMPSWPGCDRPPSKGGRNLARRPRRT